MAAPLLGVLAVQEGNAHGLPAQAWQADLGQAGLQGGRQRAAVVEARQREERRRQQRHDGGGGGASKSQTAAVAYRLMIR